MEPKELDHLKQLFHDYADTFIDPDRNDGPYLLKKKHTIRVCREILGLGRELGLSRGELVLAEAMALLHDIGRFEQFRTYNTFLDPASENHAHLGLRVIEEMKMLHGLSPRDKELITGAVGFHNAAFLPTDRDDTALFFMKLIRDADKLDIWRVVIDHYRSASPDNDKFIELGLKDDGGYSKEAFQAICQRDFVKSAHIKRLNDFKLMQISWVFDLNFAPTMARVKERRYIEQLAATLPGCADLDKALDHVFDYMDTHINDTCKPS
ncbi:MAG: HD domain-containing protein [Desulfobacteraceae bacterium]|nr:HD domain-containing protein [Desulfobacteraceae bacterium]